MLRIFFIIFASLLPFFPALGAGTTDLENPISGINSLLDGNVYIGGVIKRVLAIIGSLALLMLVYGGLSIILAAGNDTKIKQGKSIVTYTAIGLVVIFMSYAAITFFLNTLGGNLQNEYQNLPVSTDVCSGCVLPDGTRYCGLEGCNQSCSYCQSNNENQTAQFDCSRCADTSAEPGLDAVCAIFCPTD